ncbi:MAG: DUF4417 domain-containing protein [Clostridia bacterium]|nr:DUF4417 domain-containing protein [Clostridia bacterium]
MKNFKKFKVDVRAIVDDGMSSRLIEGADIDGPWGFPIIKKPSQYIIPKNIVPFSRRSKASHEDAICFHEYDPVFADVLIHPENYVDEFKGRFILSPDFSLYRNAPFAAQIINVYRNRAIGAYFQNNGVHVIPLIRWGNSLTYSISAAVSEKVAFLGIEKHSICAISTYGCIRSKEDREEFKAGLKAMLETLEPEIVLVYGSMPDEVFKDFKDSTIFICYPDWIAKNHGGNH